MNDIDREIITYLALYVKGLMEGCENCGGCGAKAMCHACNEAYIVSLHDEITGGYIGLKDVECDHCEQNLTPYSCPTCLPWRELEKVLECESRDSHGGYHGTSYPDLTTAQHGTTLLLVHWLKVTGLWDEFVEWHAFNCLPPFEEPAYGKPAGMVFIMHVFLSHAASAEILTDGEHFRDAVGSWIKGKV
jgi:hypothetical protein